MGQGTTEIGRMAKRRQRPAAKEQEAPKPRQTEFTAPGCPACESIREPGSNYSRVYNTTRTTQAVYRYCRCGYCGHTFKVVATA